MANSLSFDEWVRNTPQGVDVSTISPYKFVNDCYTGQGGFYDGRYILPFTRESGLDNRKKESVYHNHIKGIVDSLVVPVFADLALRETDNAMFEAFLGDVTGDKATIQQFSKAVVTHARIDGVTFVVMDNFEEQPSSKAEALDNRIYPYIYEKRAVDLVRWKMDKRKRLTTITFKNGNVEHKGTEVDTVIEYTKQSIIVYVDNEEREVVSRKVHDLGFVNVIPLKLDKLSTLKPMPPIYDICKVNYQIYQQGSEQRNLERNQCFSMLVLPGTPSNSEISVGIDSVLWVDAMSTMQPSYISPEPAILNGIMDSKKENTDSLLAMADVLGATAVTKNSAESGISKAYTFLGQQFALSETAQLAESFEIDVAKMFSLFVVEDVNYTVEYSDNFSPTMDEILMRVTVLEKLKAMTTNPILLAKIDAELDRLFNAVFEYEPAEVEH